MHLSPDQIERPSFAIEDHGYDRAEVRAFLAEIAAELRRLLAAEPEPEPAPAPPIAPGTVEDDFTRLGAEVADVLRSAHDAVAALHQQADVEIASRLDDARVDADEIRRQAETDAAWTQEQAKRVLTVAQEQADAIVAEAETTATDIQTSARRQARQHSEQVATRTRRHAEQILRAEREALRRLSQAQEGVAAAVEMLTGSVDRPVVDLTDLRPNVRLGPYDLLEVESDPAAASSDDSVARMIRSAVDRAAASAHEAAEAEPPEEVLASITSDDPTPRPEREDVGPRPVAAPGRALFADPTPFTRVPPESISGADPSDPRE